MIQKILLPRYLLMLISSFSFASAQLSATNWSCYQPENSSLDITVDVFSGRPNPTFTLTDLAALHAIKSRLRYYADSATASSGVTGCPSILGYRSIIIEPTCYPSFTLCSGKVLIARSAADSRLYEYPDSGNEFIRMVVQSIAHEQVGMPDTNGAVYISDIVPDSLTVPVRKFGILTWEILSDSTKIDFSVLDTPLSSMMQIGNKHVFPDVYIRWLSYSSISPTLYNLRAPYTSDSAIIVDWKSLQRGGSVPLTSQAVDSLRMDFLGRFNTVDTGCTTTFGCGDSTGGVLIRTSEGGLAYFKPVGNYIGGIDRIYLFFAYSSDGIFDTASSTVVSLKQSIRNYLSTILTGQRAFYDLKGRKVGDINVRKSCTPGASFRHLTLIDNRSGVQIIAPIDK